MKNKKIIIRNLDLTKKYSIVGHRYEPLIDGNPCNCYNCGRLISNIATVETEGKEFDIGLDCLKTVLYNNELLESDSYLKHLEIESIFSRCKTIRATIQRHLKKGNFVSYCEFTNCFGFNYHDNKGRPLGWNYTNPIENKEIILKYVKDLNIENLPS